MRSFGFDWSASSGEGITNGITKRDVVLDSEFFDLPEPTPDNGLSAYFLSPLTGGFLDRIPGEWIAGHLAPRNRKVPDHLPRPESEQYLRPWSEADSELLGLGSGSYGLSTAGNWGPA